MNLAESDGPIKTLIAETGGQNVMFVDSSSLKEQVIDDVVRSAFYSAGQRCSALRVVYVHEHKRLLMRCTFVQHYRKQILQHRQSPAL